MGGMSLCLDGEPRRPQTDSRWDWTGSGHELGSTWPHLHQSFNSLVGKRTGTPNIFPLEAQGPQPSAEAASV